MIRELAFIDVRAGEEAEFETAVALAVSTVLAKADGYLGFELRSSLDHSQRYSFEIQWETLEDHTVGFRESELFPQWRAIIGKYFANPPVIEHWGKVF